MTLKPTPDMVRGAIIPKCNRPGCDSVMTPEQFQEMWIWDCSNAKCFNWYPMEEDRVSHCTSCGTDALVPVCSWDQCRKHCLTFHGPKANGEPHRRPMAMIVPGPHGTTHQQVITAADYNNQKGNGIVKPAIRPAVETVLRRPEPTDLVLID